MKILFDTNILLDVFLKRNGLYKESVVALDYAVKGTVEGWISGATVTTTYYLVNKSLDRKEAERHIRSLFEIFHICNLNRVVLEEALKDGFRDYEDGVQYQSAIQSGLHSILTRNKRDFKKSNLPIYSPGELINILSTLG